MGLRHAEHDTDRRRADSLDHPHMVGDPGAAQRKRGFTSSGMVSIGLAVLGVGALLVLILGFMPSA